MLPNELIAEAGRLKSSDERKTFREHLRQDGVTDDALLRLFGALQVGSATATQKCDDLTLCAIVEEFKRRNLSLPESLQANHPHCA